MAPLTAYRFAGFLVSRRRRQILRDGEAVPLIPKYFDLLVLLLDRRQAVVTRREIFDEVWRDVIVSDGALTQAIRTLRRTLGDDPREPVFIRTVARHGYSFVFPEVEEGIFDEARPVSSARSTSESLPTATSAEDRIAAVGRRLLSLDDEPATLEERRDLAQQLHALGTESARRYLIAIPGHAPALAILRETRWDVEGAGAVPLWGQPEGLAAASWLFRCRLREALRVTARRWAQAAGGAAAAGMIAGTVGGALLVFAPGSVTPVRGVAVLSVLGAAAGFVSATGVAAGIVAAEAVARSRRLAAIVAGGALGGAGIGLGIQVLIGWTLSSVFGLNLMTGGLVQGACLGSAVGLGYAWSTARLHGIAAPVGPARWRTAVTAALAAGVVALLLARAGYPLVGGVIHAIAQASRGSQIALTPLGAWIGEPAFGPITQALVAVAEGTLFGFGLTWGLTRRGRPRSGRDIA